MNNAVNILQEGSMMKALTKLGIPIVIAMLIMAIYNVVDTFWIARLGTLPVAAVSVVFPLSLLFLGIGLMFGVGGGVYVSRLLGAKQIVKASQVASVSVVTSVILAALIAFMCNAFLPDILLFMGANEGMMHLAEAYGRLFIISCVIGALNVSMSNIIVSQGASKTSAMAMIIGSIVNVALDPLFIYTFNWGVEGAAWATILSRIITTAIYIRFFLSKAEVKVSFTLFAPTMRMYADIIKIGISMLFLQLLQTLSISLLQRAAVKYGAEAVAAVGIVLKIVTLGTNVVFGFVKGLQPMTGYNYGAGNFQRLKEAVRCSLILTTSFCVLWSILIMGFTSPVISCFGKDETMQGIARIALRANTIIFFTFGFQFVYSTLYMAIGRARQSLLLNIGRQGLFFIPAILLLPSYWGLNGVLYAQPVADIFATLMTLFFAVRIHREISHQSHLTTEKENNSYCQQI